MINYEQFVKVLPNEFARKTMGIDMSGSQLEFLLADEAHQIAFYDQWTRQGQPRSSHTDSVNAETLAPTRMPLAKAGVVGFWMAILSALTFPFAFFGVIVSFAALALCSMSLAWTGWNQRRGRKLAIAGVIISAIYLVAAVTYTAFFVNVYG